MIRRRCVWWTDSPDCRESGVTVIELAVVSAIFMLVLASVVAVLDSATRLEAGAGARSEKLDEMRLALDRMGKDIRQAVTVDLGSTNSRLSIQAYVAGATTPVEYSVTGSELRRAVDGGAALPIIGGLVTTAVFCYDPPACSLTAPPSQVPDIIRLILRARPATPNAEPVTLTTEIQLRNARVF